MLPPRPDLAWLRAFAAASGLTLAILVGGLVAWWASPPWGVAAGLVAGACIVGILWVYAFAARATYGVWLRLGHAYARLARWILIGILHYAILVPVSWVGRGGEFRRAPAASGWISRAPIEWQGVSQEGWWANLRALGRRPGRVWTVTLVPLLAALRVLERFEARPRDAVPTHMYTLY